MIDYRGVLLLLVVAGWTATAFADGFYLDSPYNRRTFGLEIDNDAIWNKDSNFSNGWSMQYQSLRYDRWADAKAPDAIRWVGEHFPTLGDEDSIVRMGHVIGQNMITPGDVEAVEPQAGDLPYAGTLTYSLNWQSFHRECSRTFQVTVGVLGEEALAKQFQKFAHNQLGFGSDPKGWDTQRKTEPIVNLGYRYGHRLARHGSYTNGWAGQLNAVPSVSVGNLITSMELEFGYRFGWNILEGFCVAPSPPGRGFSQASFLPKPAFASPHSVEVTLGCRFSWLIYSVIYDGSLITSDDRKVDREDFLVAGVFGLNYHYHKLFSIGLHIEATSDLLKSESLPDALPGREGTTADVSFGALIIDFHF